MWTKILLTSFLIIFITWVIGYSSSLFNKENISKYTMKVFIVEVIVIIIEVIIKIWI